MPYDVEYHNAVDDGSRLKESWRYGVITNLAVWNYQPYVYRTRGGTNTSYTPPVASSLPYMPPHQINLVPTTYYRKVRALHQVFVNVYAWTTASNSGKSNKTFQSRRYNTHKLVAVWKWYTYYVPVHSYRLEKRPTSHSSRKKKPPSHKSRYTTPNRLSFFKVYFGDMSKSPLRATNPGAPDWTREITGDSGRLGLPSSWGTSPPDPLAYQFSIRASDLYSSETSLLAEKALGKIRDKVKNQKINLANIAVEAHKTIDMIGILASRLASVLIDFKNGHLLKAASSLFPKNAKEMANEWLLLQYGIRPLITDINGAISELQSYGAKQKTKKYVATATFPIREEIDANDSWYGVKFSEATLKSTGKIVVKYRVTATITDQLMEDLNRLGVTNLASGAWEAIPFSFVVDWFLPIANWINRLDALQGWEVSSITKTTFSKVTHSFVGYVGGTTHDGWTWEDEVVNWEKNVVACEREILTSVPDMPFPHFKNPISSMHIANAIALFTQLRK